MFGTGRDGELASTRWAEAGHARADFIEAWKYSNESEVNDTNFRYGHLRDTEIQQWLNQQGQFQAPKAANGAGELKGCIRILVCERHQYSPLDFPIERDTFEQLETAFNLPTATLPSFDSDAGGYSRYYEYDQSTDRALNKINVVIKAPQKREIANYGLSMSHDLTTHTTTALLYGTNACVCDYTAFDHADPSAPTRKHTEQFILTPEADRVPARNTDLLELVRRAHKAWEHPLILPCLIVSYHTKRAKWFVEHGKVQSETHEIENALGVRGDDRPPSEFWSAALNVRTTMTRAGQEGRKEAETWTIRMNRQGLRILFTERSPEWDRECSEFLKGVLDEIKTLSHVDGTTHRKLREGLEYNITTATVVSSHLANMKGRMELQLDVLNSIVSQMDSQLSARMAASAGRDSTSMKILAVITAFFLPATFVATLFSMSMFDWQWQPPSPGDNSGGDNGEGVVSDRFWIYWSTAIPLTLVTLIGWGTWWLWEIYTFDKEFTEVAGEQSEVVKKVQWFKRLVKWLIGMKTRRGSVISTSDGMTKNDAAV